MDDKELPALPEPTLEDHTWELWGQNVTGNLFTAAQMHAYAKSALPAQTAEIARLREEGEANAKLARFGAWCALEFRDSLADVDGGSAQDAMERFGVIVKTEVTESCGEGCVCAEYGDFPHDCYTFPPEISAAMKEQANG